MHGTEPSCYVVGVDVGGVAHDRLSLAVVTAPARLQHRGQADRGNGGAEVGLGVDGVEGRGRDPERTQRLLLDDPVLRHFERRRRREHGRDRLERTRGRGGHTFPLVRDRRSRPRAVAPGRVDVVERAHDERRPLPRPVRPRPDRGTRTSRPSGMPGQAEHAAQLAPTEHRDPRHGAAR